MNTTFAVPAGIGAVTGTDGIVYPVVGGQVAMPEGAVSPGMFAGGFAKPAGALDKAAILALLGITGFDVGDAAIVVTVPSGKAVSIGPLETP